MAAGGVQRLTTGGELKVDLQKEKIPILHVDNLILSAKLRIKFFNFFCFSSKNFKFEKKSRE